MCKNFTLKKKIQAETIGNTYTLDEFAELIRDGSIIASDGTGYFVNKNGEERAEVFEEMTDWVKAVKEYPFVNWYNK